MAVDYVDAYEAGWRIFPLHPMNAAMECTCDTEGCQAAGKHPRNSAWQHTPQWDDVQMAYLEDDEGIFGGNQLQDGYGIVINTSGLLVVDVDPRNGGTESAKQLGSIRSACGFIVRTGGGGEHWYFLNPDGKTLRQTLKDHPGIDFKSTGYVVGPGSLHRSGERYEAIKGAPKDVTAAPAELLELLERGERGEFTIGKSVGVTQEQLMALVDAIPNTPGTTYHQWLEVGMALHDATQGTEEGRDIWAAWSRRGNPAETDEAIDQKWHSFGKVTNPVTAGTLVKLAKDNGYVEPVTFTDDTQWYDVPEKTRPQRDDVIADYAELAPKDSLVYQVYSWIDERCLFPRKKLAFAAATQIVSSLAGLRYRATQYRTTLNLITFAVSDSATGKEAVLQAVTELLRSAGVAKALYGRIKSEQEIVRNLIRNQASYYVIDEYGTELSKVSRAKKNGGAQYLAAVPELIMSIFTKADDYYQVSGDMAEDLHAMISQQLADANKRADSGDKKAEAEAEQLQKQLASCYDGIKQPFLTFMGITEPRSFDEAISTNTDLLVNGFIGRALLFREHDAMPRARLGYEKKPVPMLLQQQLAALANGGETREAHNPVVAAENPEVIPMTEKAEQLLAAISEYWYAEGAILEQEGQGLQTITRRAWEMVIKLAATLSIRADGRPPTITDEHVSAAQKIIKEITAFKVTHCKTVLGASSRDMQERSSGLLSGVLAVVESYGDAGIGPGVIRNRLRSTKYEPEHIDAAIAHLVSTGSVERVDYKDKRNRAQVKYKIMK